MIRTGVSVNQLIIGFGKIRLIRSGKKEESQLKSGLSTYSLAFLCL